MTAEDHPQDPRLRQIVEENAEIKALLEHQAAADLTNLHRPIEQLANLVVRPVFILACLLSFSLWIILNTNQHFTGRVTWDEPPFFWLQGLIGVLSLIITTTVLISQARQARLAEQRADLQLQVILLIGQRSAKLIELSEELRRDLPNVHNRRDEQAEALQQVMMPDAILEALDTKREKSSE